MFLQNKLKTMGSFKLCLSYSVGIVYDKTTLDYFNWKKTFKAKTILTNQDAYSYLNEIYIHEF